MTSLHRKDISKADFQLLARLCYALQVLQGDFGLLPFLLGIVEMWLPVWYRAGDGWRLAGYRPFKREAYGIETADMRRIRRYLKVREADLISMLFRLSMLAVTPSQKISDPPRFRMEFYGVPIDYYGAQPLHSFGFIIERRRADGQFRSESKSDHLIILE